MDGQHNTDPWFENLVQAHAAIIEAVGATDLAIVIREADGGLVPWDRNSRAVVSACRRLGRNIPCHTIDAADHTPDELERVAEEAVTAVETGALGPPWPPAPGGPAVRVYDAESNKTVTIPARELAPGMTRAHVFGNGVAGEAWLGPSEYDRWVYMHPPFSESYHKNYFRRFAEVFHDVHPLTPEEWDDSFRRDMHPDREIACWFRMADVFERFTRDGRQRTFEQRRDIFRVILAAANNGPEYVRYTTSPVTLSAKRVREIVAYMFPGHG
jgi:hypothetical protein